MPKVAVIAKITPLPEHRDEVVSVLRQLVAASQEEEGTLTYAMNLDKQDGAVWFYELYADDAAFAAHGGSEAMKAVGSQLRDKAAGRPELHVLEVLDGKGLPA